MTPEPGHERPIVVDSQAWTGNEAEAEVAARATYRAQRRFRGEFLAAGSFVFAAMGVLVLLLSIVALLRGGGQEVWKGLLASLGAIAFGIVGRWLGHAVVRRFSD